MLKVVLCSSVYGTHLLGVRVLIVIVNASPVLSSNAEVWKCDKAENRRLHQSVDGSGISGEENSTPVVSVLIRRRARVSSVLEINTDEAKNFEGRCTTFTVIKSFETWRGGAIKIHHDVPLS